MGAVLYLAWAYVPESVLHSWGITYYPSKQWATSLPAWFCVSIVFGFWVYERCAVPVICFLCMCDAVLALLAPPHQAWACEASGTHIRHCPWCCF